MARWLIAFAVLAVSPSSGHTGKGGTFESFVTARRDTYRKVDVSKSDSGPLRVSGALAATRSQLSSAEHTEVRLKARRPHSPKSSTGIRRTRILLVEYKFEADAKSREAHDALATRFPKTCSENNRFRCQDFGSQVQGYGYKTTPGIIIFNPKTIVVAGTDCASVDKKEWSDFTNDFIGSFATDASAIVIAGCGKVRWTTKAKRANELGKDQTR